jgi:AraC family transcriptional regulator
MITTTFPEQKIISSLRNDPQKNQEHFKWPNVIVSANVGRYSKTVPESALTVVTNREGNALISYKNRSIRVCEQSFFIINPFQEFSYQINSDVPVKTLNFHFSYSFFQKAIYSLLNSDDFLLSYPEDVMQSFTFLNQLHFKDKSFPDFITGYTSEDTDGYFLSLLQYMVRTDSSNRKKMFNIRTSKSSTRKELFRRVSIARDMIFSQYNLTGLSLDDLSHEAGMSRYHFLRIFTQVYSCTPYQMLKNVRLFRAKYLLENTTLPVSEIAYSVGYEESNAIYPALKKFLSDKPGNWRKQISNFR